MILTPQQVYNVTRDAGFTPDITIKVMGIAKCESGFNPYIIGYNQDSIHSVDRGLMQWNSYWHKEVTDEQAFTPRLCMQQVYRVSVGGVDFSAWDSSSSCHADMEASFRPYMDDFEALYQKSKLPPDAGEFAMSMCSAAEFRRRGWAWDGMVQADRDNIAWANKQANP